MNWEELFGEELGSKLREYAEKIRKKIEQNTEKEETND